MTREKAIQHLLQFAEDNKYKSNEMGFLSGLIHVALRNPWHTVSEELPKEGAFLVCKMGKQPIYKTLEYSSERDGFWTSSGGFITRDGVREYFTHWMPIPEISKEDRV